jgi:hypothetical protein
MSQVQAVSIESQAQKVRIAYAKTGNVNPEYEREFEILSNMRLDSMAANFRDGRGLPPDGKTPYDRPISASPVVGLDAEARSDLRLASMADQFRKSRGLPHNAKTPYDPRS